MLYKTAKVFSPAFTGIASYFSANYIEEITISDFAYSLSLIHI